MIQRRFFCIGYHGDVGTTLKATLISDNATEDLANADAQANVGNFAVVTVAPGYKDIPGE